MSNKNVTTLDSAPVSEAPKASGPAAPEPIQVKPAAASGAGEFSGQRSIVTIAAGPEEGGNHAVFVGVAGVGFQIPRGKASNVPVEVADVLRNAVTTHYIRNEESQKVERIESPRYSFIAQDIPVQAAVAA